MELKQKAIEGETDSKDEVINFVKNQIEEKMWAIHIYRRETDGKVIYSVSSCSN